MFTHMVLSVFLFNDHFKNKTFIRFSTLITTFFSLLISKIKTFESIFYILKIHFSPNETDINRSIECILCNLSFNSKKEFLNHTLTSEHLVRTRELIDDEDEDSFL